MTVNFTINYKRLTILIALLSLLLMETGGNNTAQLKRRTAIKAMEDKQGKGSIIYPATMNKKCKKELKKNSKSKKCKETMMHRNELRDLEKRLSFQETYEFSIMEEPNSFWIPEVSLNIDLQDDEIEKERIAYYYDHSPVEYGGDSVQVPYGL